MKQYAREALKRHGVANYVIDDKSFFDELTDELYMHVNPVLDSEQELARKMAKETFSLSAKAYPRHPPSAPRPTPRAVLIERHPTFLTASPSTLERIISRVTKPTFSQKLHAASEPPEPSRKSCASHLHLPSAQRRQRTSLHDMIKQYPQFNAARSPRLVTPSPVPWHTPSKVRFRSATSTIPAIR